MARPFVIDEETGKRIRECVKYAEANRYSLEMLDDMVNGRHPVAGDIPGHYVYIPVGFKVVLVLEMQSHGIVRHMSISINKPRAAANPHIVQILMPLFGFKSPLEDDTPVHIQETETGHIIVHLFEVEPYLYE